MNPIWLFPLLTVAFAVAAAWRGLRTGSLRGAPAIWLMLALIFALVSLWLRIAP